MATGKGGVGYEGSTVDLDVCFCTVVIDVRYNTCLRRPSRVVSVAGLAGLAVRPTSRGRFVAASSFKFHQHSCQATISGGIALEGCHAGLSAGVILSSAKKHLDTAVAERQTFPQSKGGSQLSAQSLSA